MQTGLDSDWSDIQIRLRELNARADHHLAQLDNGLKEASALIFALRQLAFQGIDQEANLLGGMAEVGGLFKSDALGTARGKAKLPAQIR